MPTLADFPQKTNRELVCDLLTTLTLMPINNDVFRGESMDYVGPRVFGGQVLGQALMSASMTISDGKPCHSLHAYFLLGGDIRYPVFYEVTRLRDGKNLSARQVRAYQEYEGKTHTIFVMMASFAHLEGGLDHHNPMPAYPHFETLSDEQSLKNQYFNEVPESLHKQFARRRHILVKPVHPQNPVKPTPTEPKQAIWCCVPELGMQSVAVQQALLAFMSDYYLVTTGLLPHGVNMITRGLQIASIDHSIHFHRPFDVEKWLLYDMKSDTTSHAKGLNFGQFWQDGKLVATTHQEGLMRLNRIPNS